MKENTALWDSELKKVAEEDLDPGWERVTIILNSDDFGKLKTISDVKGIFVKDIVNGLIQIYNSVAVTDKDNENIEEEKAKLTQKIKDMVEVQEEARNREEEKSEKK